MLDRRNRRFRGSLKNGTGNNLLSLLRIAQCPVHPVNHKKSQKKKMDKSEKFWNRNANGYDREEMKDRAVRTKILEKVRNHLEKKDDVLDYGCATGIIANEIAGDVNTVHGIDISPEMIRIARNKAIEHSIRNVAYTRSTIFDTGLKEGTFDVILGIYVLHLLEDMPDVLRRIHELLKPGGLFISVTPCLGKKSLAGIALLLVSKTGLIPTLKLLNLPDLEGSITHTDFEILETERLQQSGRQYFIVAKKSQEAS